MALRLLCCIAHPDDECFGFGGALTLAAQRGIETYVICLTPGNAGSYRGTAQSDEELAQLRREEFQRSCAVLGVTHGEVWDYPDGKLEFVDFSRVAGELVAKIRNLKPQIILTFGLDGGPNIHPDHMMVSALTHSAYHWADRAKRYPEAGAPYQPQRLYTATSNVPLPDRQPPNPSPWSVVLDITSVQQVKVRAFEEHTTQAPLMELTRGFFEQHGGQEYFTLAADTSPHPVSLGVDLFSGLVEE